MSYCFAAAAKMFLFGTAAFGRRGAAFQQRVALALTLASILVEANAQPSPPSLSPPYTSVDVHSSRSHDLFSAVQPHFFPSPRFKGVPARIEDVENCLLPYSECGHCRTYEGAYICFIENDEWQMVRAAISQIPLPSSRAPRFPRHTFAATLTGGRPRAPLAHRPGARCAAWHDFLPAGSCNQQHGERRER